MTSTTQKIGVLREANGEAFVSSLRRAWDSKVSFAIQPPHGIDKTWWRSALDAIPAERSHGHFVLQTSGSTGSPKLVVGAQERAAQLARVVHDVQDNEPVEETILCLPLSYSFAFVNQWVWSIVTHRRFVWTAGFRDPRALAHRLARAKQAMLCLVGSQIPLLRNCCGKRTFPGVIRIHFAGGRFPQEQLGFLGTAFPYASVTNNYGCAEALPRLTVRSADVYHLAAQIGHPVPGVELRQDSCQLLQFRSPYQAVGLVDDNRYYEPETDEWLPTGDRASQEPDGSWRLLGREGEVFKRYGEKVSLLAVRDWIQSRARGGIALYRDEDGNGEPGYVLVLTQCPALQERTDLLLQLRKQFTRPHWPLRIEHTDKLPLTVHGKVDTNLLRSQALETIWEQYV